jgi:DNA-binding IclR family transcriptional regulator
MSSDLMALLSRPSEHDAGAYTSREIARALGVSESTVRRRLLPLVESGAVECVSKTITDLARRTQPVPAYRLAA